MTIDVIAVDPVDIKVTKNIEGTYPKLEFSPDFKVLLNSWSQLRDLRDSINDALSEFEASEMKDVEVGQ